MVFNIGDIIELASNILFYEKGLLCQVVKLEDGKYGYVKILESHSRPDLIGQTKHANLTLFKLVRKGGLCV